MNNKDKCLTPWLKVENRLERSGLLDRKTYARITLYTETLYLPYVFLDPCRIKKGYILISSAVMFILPILKK